MNSISAQNVSVRINGKTILHEVDFLLPEGDSLAIVGLSGSGKTILGKLICGLISANSGQIVLDKSKVCLMIEQQDNLLVASHLPSGYYSQRYENLGLEEVPKVGDYLSSIIQSGKGNIGQFEVEDVLQQMNISYVSEKKLMFLSNGERKRLQLAVALLQNPDILIFDQPFVGLDILARKMLEELLIQLHQSGKTILLICDQEHIPEQIDWVLEMKNGTAKKLVQRAGFVGDNLANDDFDDVNHLFDFVVSTKKVEFEYAVRMKNVNVSFNGNAILKNIDWQVKKGERWALFGPNGAGKTTLLSLITADNPQGYSNDLTLFDRKRGSGESIWDIKRKIGFVSPEIHLYFLHGKGIFNTIPGLDARHEYSGTSLPCEDVISSGFQDLIGFTDLNSRFRKQTVSAWLSIMRLSHLSGRPFHEASLSEQRMLLLARALVKMPSMLILDEPCQGLDQNQTKHFIKMLDAICAKLDTTMIYVTHYPEEIPFCVSHLLELEGGQIKEIKEF